MDITNKGKGEKYVKHKFKQKEYGLLASFRSNPVESALCIIAIIVVVAFLGGLGWIVYDEIQENQAFDAWFASLTPTKQAEYLETQKVRHDIVSVNQYIVTETNRFGGIRDTYVAYTFSYVDEKGNLHQIDNFVHYDSGYTQIQIGDRDQYVIDEYEGKKYLILTEETLARIQINN